MYRLRNLLKRQGARVASVFLCAALAVTLWLTDAPMAYAAEELAAAAPVQAADPAYALGPPATANTADGAALPPPDGRPNGRPELGGAAPQTGSIVPLDVPLTGTQLPANTVTAARTQQAVTELYNTSIRSYNKADLFAAPPEENIGGYKPGTLSEDAKTKTLAQINYFRNLAGLNSVILHPTRFDYGQYGATGLEIVGRLTHSFTSGEEATLKNYMTAHQLDMAKAAISAGNTDPDYILWNGNCSTSNNIVEDVQNYIDDTANVVADVGHRMNFLDINSQAVVFGAGARHYDCFSLYGSPFQASNPNTQAYYAWPPEGYFPKQSIADGAMWSVVLSKDYANSLSGSPGAYTSGMRVYVAYGGVSAEATNLLFDMNYNLAYPCVTFSLPASVKAAIQNTSSVYNNGGTSDVTVTVTGIKDSGGADHFAQWTTMLYQAPLYPAQVTGIRSAQTTYHVVKNKTLTIPYVADLKAGEARTPVFTWKSSNNNYVSVTQSGKVKGLVAGKSAKITITSDNGVTKTFTVKVAKAAVKAASVSVVKPPKTIKVGATAVLKVKVNPSKATGAVVTFSLDKASKKVVTVDKAGKVTALKKGTAKITVKAGGQSTVVTIMVK